MIKLPVFQKLLNIIDSVLFPYVRCIACGKENELSEEKLCPKCTKYLISKTVMEKDMDGLRVIAPYEYDGVAASLVRNLKFKRDAACVKPLADGLVYAFVNGSLRKCCDMIVPVPISKRRMIQRGFNQSDLLAQALGKTCDVPVKPECLKRIRHTKEQSKLSGEKRRQNVLDAFEANNVKGKRIVLIDDVVTTGSTAKACADALLKAGAKEVTLLAATIAGNPSKIRKDKNKSDV